jgi:CheY-like chemotaxis protein
MNKKINILLVEDDDVDAMLVMKALEKEKLANPVVRAFDGIDAFEKLRDGSVDSPYLILLDLNMPRMSGLEFLARIREDLKLKSAIIFVFTTSNTEKDRWGAYDHNIAGYILKDDVGSNLVEAIKLLDGFQRVVEFPWAR